MYAAQDIVLDAEPRRLSWLQHSLARQFILVAFGVLLLGMFTLGTWVARKIENGVAEIASASAALYINSLLAPHLQELATSDTLSLANIESINQALSNAAVRTNVVSVKIWKEGGLVAFSTDKELMGRTFPLKDHLQRAWHGMIAAQFVDHHHAENAGERATGLHLLEVYAPVRQINTGKVIAVLEFYEHAGSFEAQLSEAEWHSWAMTALVTIAMMTALFSIVANGSRTIDEQRMSLTQRVTQLSDLLRQNQMLRSRIERASRNVAEDNERFIRGLGYDLHDGPAQLISLALLRLDALSLSDSNHDNMVAIRSALSDALSDIRNFCAGLLLPQIQGLTLNEALIFIVRDHERRTRTVVDCHISQVPCDPPPFVKICLCRFVQEGLNNAFRHAAGRGQRVSAAWDGQNITIDVADEGPGMSMPDVPGDRIRLGLTGLWDRIESIGGTMTVNSIPGKGTRLSASLPLTTGETNGR